MTDFELVVFKLASHLKMKVSDILDMSYSEFEGWLLFYGSDDEWTQTGLVCAALYNTMTTSKKTFQASDFTPQVKDDSKMNNKLRAWALSQQEKK